MTEIIVGPIGLILIGFIIYDVIKNHYVGSSCPNCQADLFGKTLLKSDNLGPNYDKPQYNLYRDHYVCKKCGHEWSTDRLGRRADRAD